jgi:hypothetical protein
LHARHICRTGLVNDHTVAATERFVVFRYAIHALPYGHPTVYALDGASGKVLLSACAAAPVFVTCVIADQIVGFAGNDPGMRGNSPRARR